MHSSIIIVGGGLAGLTVARFLHKAGVGFLLLEARDRLGGRILSADATGRPAADGFDLGPSWFWPGMQPQLAALVAELGLPVFAQASEGDIIFQRSAHESPQRFPGMRQEPPSMRVAGGSGALIAALAADLPADSFLLDARVTQLALNEGGVELHFVRSNGAQKLHASYVVLALPPRVAEATISFAPALDAQTARRWRGTPTWMAPHAKFFALYERPFWREAGLSGAAQSMVGPLVEIHDATSASGAAALFGFVGVPAGQRRQAGRDAIIAASIRQSAALFGPQAASPVAALYKDWADDPLTATAADAIATGHPVADRQPWIGGEWGRHVLLAGSETSMSEPGYLAGAVEAGERAAGELIARFGDNRGTG